MLDWLRAVRWERDSPEALSLRVLIDKFDAVTGYALNGGQPGDDTSGNLSALFVAQCDDGAHHQFATDLHRSAMLIQVGGSGIYREGTLLAVFPRQPYRSAKGHPSAPAPGHLAVIGFGSRTQACTMGFPAAFRGFQAHADHRID